MKTYPIRRNDGSLLAFEIGNSLISLRRISMILEAVPGVSSVLKMKSWKDRLSFELNGVSCVVNEPYGDNSRYWIGPARPESSSVDLETVERAFADYHGPLAKLASSLFGHGRTSA